MATPFATLADLRTHWSKLPAADEDDAEQKLAEASIEVRSLYRDVDSRIALWVADNSNPLGLDPDVPRLVVCRMVKRAMDNASRGGLDGVNSVQESTGPFAQTLNFTNPEGNLYLSKSDKRLLAAGRPGRQAWTIMPSGVA